MSEPLPPELSRFVVGERNAPVTGPAAQAAVRAKLAATLGIATVAGGAATASAASSAGTTAGAGTAAVAAGGAVKSALALKLIAVALTIGASAAVTTVVVTRQRAQPAPVRREKSVVGTREAAQPRASAIRVEPIEPAPAPDAPAPTPVAEPPRKHMKHVVPSPVAPTPPVEAAPAEPATRSQSQLLADATRSLSLGDAARALELIDEDTRMHAAGPLVEEREALRISALSALGRTAEAKDVARQLIATYPHSIHRRLAERVLAEETP
jgi:hypothetical protein